MTVGSNPNGIVPMVTSIAGAQIFTAGQTALPMAIAQANNTGTPNLATVLNPSGFNTSAASVARRNAFNQLRTVDLNSNYVSAASNVTELAMQANAALRLHRKDRSLPNNSIGLQFKQVAR